MRNSKGQFIKGCVPECTQGMRGKKHSKITKRKMSENNGKFWKGKHFSKEHLEKLSKIHIGVVPWNKGKHILEKTRKKISEASKGRKFSEEHKRKIGNAQKEEKGNNWQGGITPENLKIRNSIEISLWREAVFARDNWTCQKYKIKGGKLHCHHIKNFSQFPELRTAIENGITFSKKAHREFHKKYGQQNNTLEQIKEFLC